MQCHQRLLGTTGLLIKVQDIEDKPPEFVSVPSVTRIAEDVPTFTEVSYKV